MEIGEESEAKDILEKIREEVVKNFIKKPDAEKIGLLTTSKEGFPSFKTLSD
jgi:hypothetical protein